MACLPRALEQIDQPGGDEGVVIQETRSAEDAVAKRAREPAGLGRAQSHTHEISRALGRRNVARLAQDPAGDGKGADGESVPSGDDLVIAQRWDSRAAYRGQLLACRRQLSRNLLVGTRLVKNVGAFEIAFAPHPEVAQEHLGFVRGSQHGANLVLGPREVLAFFAF